MRLLFQLIFLLFALGAIFSVLEKRRARVLSARGAFFWVLLWLLALGAVFFPNSTTILANMFGIGRGADFVVYLALAATGFALFRLHVKIEALGRDLTTLTRRDALKEKKALDGDHQEPGSTV